MPARNNAIAVIIASSVSASCVLYAGYFFFLWLSRSEQGWSFLYDILSNLLLFTGVFAVRALLRQLVTRKIIFERWVIGVEERLLGIRVRRRWINVSRITRWLDILNPQGTATIGFEFAKTRERTSKVIWQMPSDQWLNLITRMQRKDFVYV
ncbi:hypothetical protein GCM10022270_09530 [Terriglobus aquaticus]